MTEGPETLKKIEQAVAALAQVEATVDAIKKLEREKSRKRRELEQTCAGGTARAAELLDKMTSHADPPSSAEMTELIKSCRLSDKKRDLDSRLREIDEKILKLKRKLLPPRPKHNWRVVEQVPASELAGVLNRQEAEGWIVHSLYAVQERFVVVARRREEE